jgi:hypothetical protein
MSPDTLVDLLQEFDRTAQEAVSNRDLIGEWLILWSGDNVSRSRVLWWIPCPVITPGETDWIKTITILDQFSEL